MTATALRPVEPAASELADRDDLLMFFVMHQAMRSQSRALVAALEWFGEPDHKGAVELRDWYRQMFQTIEHHHVVEDSIFFPMMVAYEPEVAALGERMAADHHVLDERLHDVADALEALVVATGGEVDWRLVPDGWVDSVRRDAIRAAQALGDCLDDHLDREEAESLPVFLRSVPKVEMAEGHRRAMEDGDRSLMPFVFGWALPSTSPAQEAQLLSTLPRLVRALARFVWLPRYEKAYPRMAAAQRELLEDTAFTRLAPAA
jgi:hemerythrin-like domain-containing protein